MTPFELPSAIGLTNSGGARATRRASLASATTSNAAVARPESRTIRLAMPLSSVTAQVSGSAKVYGCSNSSHSAGTCASRERPRTPSAKLNRRSQRSPATSRRASSLPRPMRTTSLPSSAMVEASAAMVSSASNSITSAGANPAAR